VRIIHGNHAAQSAFELLPDTLRASEVINGTMALPRAGVN
jgi:hypothetical protein